DTVTVGGSSGLQAIGFVNITNQLGRTALTINDAHGQTAARGMLLSNDFFGSAPMSSVDDPTDLRSSIGEHIAWVEDDLLSLTINSGNGGNTIDIIDTPSNSGFQGVTFNTGTGSDTVTEGFAAGALTINGQAGRDTVHLAEGLGAVKVTN